MLKKTLCLMLSLVLVLLCAGCRKPTSPSTPSQGRTPVEPVPEPTEELIQEETLPDPETAILGSWIVCIYITAENSGLEGFETDAGLPALITFDETGRATMTAYAEGLDDAYDALKQDLVNYVMELQYSQMEEAGYTREEVDERFLDLYDITLEAHAQDSVERLDLHDKFLRLAQEAEYELIEQEDGRRVLVLNGKQELTYELRSTTLTILDSTNAKYWEAHGMEFPVTLKRVNVFDILKNWF